MFNFSSSAATLQFGICTCHHSNVPNMVIFINRVGNLYGKKTILQKEIQQHHFYHSFKTYLSFQFFL